MDSTRKQQLKALIRSRFEDNQQKFADCVGLSKGRISQLLDDAQPFGERAAKNLFDKLANAGVYLPYGYFDGLVIVDEAHRVGTRPEIGIEDAIAAIRMELERVATKPVPTVHIEHAWPFERIKREQWDSMTPAQKDAVETIIQTMLAPQRAAGANASHTEKRQATG